MDSNNFAEKTETGRLGLFNQRLFNLREHSLYIESIYISLNRWWYGLEVLPPVCSDPAGARQAGDEEPLRSQDDSWVC